MVSVIAGGHKGDVVIGDRHVVAFQHLLEGVQDGLHVRLGRLAIAQHLCAQAAGHLLQQDFVKGSIQRQIIHIVSRGHAVLLGIAKVDLYRVALCAVDRCKV